jgi:hypothetical protein
MRGDNSIGIIVKDCTTAIWECLQPEYMPIPNRGMWKSIAKRYYELWDLPNCIGSVDGKHVRIKKFYNSGSSNFNYKGFFSVVLMASADADNLFITIDVGDIGRNSDGAVFRSSQLGTWLERDRLDIPNATRLPNGNPENPFPYYFVGDEAFPLKKNIMRPFPQRVLTNERRVFNYRLSRGRKSVECAFGILCAKFSILDTPIRCQETVAVSIIKAACVLHNFIRINEGKFTTPAVFKSTCVDVPETDAEVIINKTAYALRDELQTHFINNPILRQESCII